MRELDEAGKVWDQLELEDRERIARSFLLRQSRVERYGPITLQWSGISLREKWKLESAMRKLGYLRGCPWSNFTV